MNTLLGRLHKIMQLCGVGVCVRACVRACVCVCVWKYNGALLDVSNTAKYLVNPRTARLFISVVTTSDAISSIHVSGMTQQLIVV